MRYLILITMFLLPCFAQAKNFSIAAIVNDTIITNMDVDERVKLFMATTGLPSDAATQEKIRGQVLSSIIDETLKLQEAKRYNFMVSASERKGALDMLNAQNKQIEHPEGFLGALKEKGVSEDSFMTQLDGEILWSKVVRDRIARNVSVSGEEISRAQQQIVNSVQEEVNIASLILPVPSPEEEARVKALATTIANDAKDAATFMAIARQLGSQGLRSIIAPQWVPAGRLDPAYRNAISALEAGQVSQPVRTPNGYEVLLYNGRRERTAGGDSELYLKQVRFPIEKDDSREVVEEMLEIAKMVKQNPGDCFVPSIAGLDNAEELGIDIDFFRTNLSAMAEQIRPLVADLQVGSISNPIPAPDGVQMLMVCERIALPPEMPDAEKVRKALFEEKVALETQKYLRNLRRDAFIEKRDAS